VGESSTNNLSTIVMSQTASPMDRDTPFNYSQVNMEIKNPSHDQNFPLVPFNGV
jgi:hypothetical protein